MGLGDPSILMSIHVDKSKGSERPEAREDTNEHQQLPESYCLRSHNSDNDSLGFIHVFL